MSVTQHVSKVTQGSRQRFTSSQGGVVLHRVSGHTLVLSSVDGIWVTSTSWLLAVKLQNICGHLCQIFRQTFIFISLGETLKECLLLKLCFWSWSDVPRTQGSQGTEGIDGKVGSEVDTL